VATATLAAVAGGGGLGEIIVNKASYGTAGVVAGAIAVAVLAFVAELALAAVQHAMTPAGLRSASRATRLGPTPEIGPSI
jgi:osmoprotectant transport system permease protein